MTDAVLTTGANSGIGLATVIELARAGYRSIGSVRSDDKADAVGAPAAAGGREVETVLLDVTDADACAAVLDDIGVDLYGLVNNAGYGMTGAIEDVTDDEARQLIETMVIAPMRLARLVLPGMRRAGRGRIVNVSSIMGLVTTPLTGWYQGAKHALEAVTDALRVEVAGDGIHVALVEPGGFRTEHLGRHGARHRKARRLAIRHRVPPEPARHEAVVADDGRATPVREGHRDRDLDSPSTAALSRRDGRACARDDGPLHADRAEGPHHSHRPRPVT